jgi:hypothetical protein
MVMRNAADPRLALMRCVGSSPAAAASALRNKGLGAVIVPDRRAIELIDHLRRRL